MTTAELPEGVVLRLGREVWRHEGGRILVGGAPTRVVRLADRARRLFDGDELRLADPDSRRLGTRLLAAGLAHPAPESLPPAPGALTVVIPTYGRARGIGRLLGSLRGYDVVVVDDGSPRAEAAALARVTERHGARLLRLPENAGPAAARNAGLAAATTPYVAFVDSDVVVPAGALDALLREFADPGLAVVGPRVAGLPGGAESWVARYERARSSLDLGPDPALVRPRSRVSWLSSTCLVARRDALGAGFGDGMRVAEDVDLVWRLDRAGWRVRYAPHVVVGHEHRTRLLPMLRRKAFYGTGAAVLAESHAEAVAPVILRPWTVGVLAALLAQRWWSIPAALAIAVPAARRIRRDLPEGARSVGLAARLTGAGVLAGLTQASALALRHWWPAALVGAVLSRRVRHAVVAAAIVDAGVEYVRLAPDLDPARFLVARRLDDLAYGTGLWLGAFRRRSARALLPEILPRES